MKKQKIIKFQNRLNKELKSKKFKKYFDEEAINVKIALEIANLRKKNNLTQKALAYKMHLPQQAISRLEQPDYTGYTLKTLIKLAEVFDKELLITFR